MKLNMMRKDACGNGVGVGGGGGGAAPSSPSSLPVSPISCFFDVKPLVATLLLGFSLLMALWHLQPYDSLLLFSHPSDNASSDDHASSSSSSSSCPISAAAAASISNSTTGISTSVSPAAEEEEEEEEKKQKQKQKQKQEEDPNVRVFRAYGSSAALFVQMGAYRGGPYTFAVVGLASKPAHVFGKPWFKCEWVPNSRPESSVRAKAYKMLPDWGYGRVYTVVVVNCTFPVVPNADNAGGRLLLHAYYAASPKRYERFVALEEAPGAYDPSRFRPPYAFDYLYCGSPLYGDLSPRRVREWMAYHARFFGPRSHFVLHDAGGVGPAVRAALEPWVRAGRATLQDIRAQAAYDGYYYNQFLVVNDCLHRYRHAANWTFFFDLDEYLYLPGARSLPSVLAELSPFTQFTIEQNPMSSKLCVLRDDPAHDYSRYYHYCLSCPVILLSCRTSIWR